ncbi:AbrB/MazE/SpoVT family DNA-binding domain-containing protein [Heyndrickxia camelliae]|uniref:SpoVT-AbrB domain-containing protein n=1 Tax=Heyndrickxia camelliae TaxID=1707093 RepID=A0A2N3LEP3_9BACI|nr:AbrB/MazE/SpoVT family DNA-binding domain-containing protein [Heyndrickxia camelliae]PKR83024.1 hypothetical protein CWO92_21020 [Heyndrickxia camelliae]
MRATGVTRKVDPLGRIVLPSELRKVYEINENDKLEIFTNEDTIILRKFRKEQACIFTGDILPNNFHFSRGKIVINQEIAKELLLELKSHFNKEN